MLLVLLMCTNVLSVVHVFGAAHSTNEMNQQITKHTPYPHMLWVWCMFFGTTHGKKEENQDATKHAPYPQHLCTAKVTAS
jgi:hypothetical protein